jgi:hypothetical protein
MSFAESIRILKIEKPRVDVIVSGSLASAVFFDENTGERGRDYTSPKAVERPPAEMALVELIALAGDVLIEMGYRGQRKVTTITDGDGKVLAAYPPDPSITVNKATGDVLINGHLATEAELKMHATEIVKAAGVTLIGSEPEPELRSKFNPINAAPKKRKLPQWSDLKIVAETRIPEPDTKARGKVTITRLVPITDSSVVDHVGYDPKTCTLEVGIKKFFVKPPTTKVKVKAKKGVTRGRTVRVIRYRFKDVPSEIFLGIIAAESVGVYFNTMVKPHYIGRRVA